MKKFLGAALSAALMLPSGWAGAELLKNLKVGGQLDVQANSAINVSDFHTTDLASKPSVNDHLGDTLTRVMLNATWDLLDDVHAKITLRKNDRAWGGSGAGGEGAGNFGGTAQDQTVATGGGVLGNTYVNESFIKIDKLMGADATVGRQFYGDPGDLVVSFGPKDNYGLIVNALDALRIDHSCEYANITGIAGKISGPAGVAIGGLPEAGTDIRGLDIGIKNLPVKANVIVYDRVIHNTGQLGNPSFAPAAVAGGLNDNLWVYGLKVRGDWRGGWLSAEIDQNAGENRTQVPVTGGTATRAWNYSGTAFLAKAGYKWDVANVGGITPWGNFGFGTGQGDALSRVNDGFTSIASDYRPGIINHRFSQSLTTLGGGSAAGALIPTAGLNNRVVYGIGVNANPARWSKLTTSVQYWNYQFQKLTHNSAVLDPVLAGACTAGGNACGNKQIGSEFGLTANWQHSDAVGVGAGWAIFMPGGYVQNAFRTAAGGGAGPTSPHDPVRLLYADLTVKF